MPEETEVQTTETETAPESVPEKVAAEIGDFTSDVDFADDLSKWKAYARLNEKRNHDASARADRAEQELEKIRRDAMSETERAIEQARLEAQSSVRQEYAGKLVEAELKSALNGRVLDGNAILSFDKTAFITDGGDIDTESISAWVEAHTKTAEAALPDLGQGVRGKTISGVAQIRSRDELAAMTPDEILAARKDGRLDSLMGKI